MYPLNNQRREKVDRAIESKEDAKKRLPAIADRAIWEKVTKGRAGTRWDSVVEKVWMDRGGNQQEVMSVLREVCGVREWNKRNDSNKGKANANQQGEGGATLEAFTGG